MKVLMVTAFPERPDCISGGVAAVCVYLTRELARIPGLTVDVLAVGSSGEERVEDFEGVRVHYLPRGRLPLAGFRLLWELPRIVRTKMRQLKSDVVHVQGYAPLAASLECPNVLTIHGIPELDARYVGRAYRSRLKSTASKLIEQWVRPRLRNVIVISPYVRSLLNGQLCGRTWDIENPVAESFFGHSRQPVPGRVLFCGLIVPRKNVSGLIEAFSGIASSVPGAQLRLAGSGAESDYGHQCQNLGARLGVQDRLVFLGPLSVSAIQQEMAAASCLVLCSHQETAPVVIEEAMAMGLPVVASRICGIPYMVDDGRTGKLVDPTDVSHIAAAIEEVLQTDRQAEMASAAVAQAQERFRASVVARRTYDVYEEVLSDWNHS